MSDWRYRSGAIYDHLSLERLVYGVGRRAGIAQLDLRPGDTVLDIGCGTGLSFALLRDAVGDQGRVIGVEPSSAMADRARSRAASSGWSNVAVIETDARELSAHVNERVSAALFVYSLSVIKPWIEVWDATLEAVRAGGRLLVVDMDSPHGQWSLGAPLARAACLLGGADISRHPWQRVEHDLTDRRHEVLRGGHIHAVSGSKGLAT